MLIVYSAKIQLAVYADLICLISNLIKVSIRPYNDNEENGYDREGAGSELIQKVRIYHYPIRYINITIGGFEPERSELTK